MAPATVVRHRPIRFAPLGPRGWAYLAHMVQGIAGGAIALYGEPEAEYIPRPVEPMAVLVSAARVSSALPRDRSGDYVR
jgi:hypothetical protein